MINIIKYQDGDLEYRFYYTGSLMVTSNDIKMIKFDLEMKEHFRKEQEKQEDQILALKLYSKLNLFSKWRFW